MVYLAMCLLLRANLHGTISDPCDKLTTGLQHNLYDSCSILKHVLKCGDIFSDAHANRKCVVDLS